MENIPDRDYIGRELDNNLYCSRIKKHNHKIEPNADKESRQQPGTKSL